jgi:multidrug efflux pump subunit AcrB
MVASNDPKPDWLSRLTGQTMQGPLPLLILLVAIVGGMIALMITPREEEPQIIVPLADVLVAAPGFSAEQVERQIATPLAGLETA